MGKYAAIIEYDGTEFYGWQSQSHVRNVQDCVEAAFSQIANQKIQITCAGRTDTGVHALGQVIHFETDVKRSLNEWLRGTNANLPEDVGVRHVQKVADDFHARFSALSRHYRYVILNDTHRPVLQRKQMTWIYKPLDADIMHRAVQILVGEHDFSSFRAAGCQSKSPIRQVIEATVKRDKKLIYFDICANAFLQHMVRNIIGTVIAIGTGELAEGYLKELLACRDRNQAGMAAESTGLYLRTVEYPVRFEIPKQK